VPKIDKACPVDVSIRYREGIEEVTPEEISLIEANLPELLKLMAEEMDKEGVRP
jgi:hypothetical protein